MVGANNGQISDSFAIFSDSSADRFVLFLPPPIYYNFRICSHWFQRVRFKSWMFVAYLEYLNFNASIICLIVASSQVATHHLDDLDLFSF